MSSNAHRYGVSVRIGVLLAFAAGCGDNQNTPDADVAAPRDGHQADGPAIAADANIIDAAIASDAVPGSSCAAAIVLQAGESHLDDTRSRFDTGGRSCSPASSASPDALYRVDLPDVPTDLLVNALVDEDLQPPYDLVLAVETECGSSDTEVACADFGLSESLEALALSGSVFIYVDGTAQYGGSPAGSYQLDVRERSIAALDEACDASLQNSRCESGLRCVAEQCVADSTLLACQEAQAVQLGIDSTGHTHAFASDHFHGSCAFDPAAGAPEEVFTLTLTQTSNLRISTDLAATKFDTVVYLLSACQGSELACQDDVNASAGNFSSTLLASAVPPGDYLIIIDGSSPQAPSGRFGLRVDVTPI